MTRSHPPWQPLFDRIRVFRDGAFVYAPPPTDADLNRLEARLGSRLPASYRAFMKRFGPGVLQEWVLLASPVVEAEGGVVGLTELHRDFAREHRESYPNHAWLATLVYFASSAGAYAWSPAEATQAAPRECRFYFLKRLQEEHPDATGDSFWQFVEWVEANVNAWMDDPARGLTFAPPRLRAKERPHHLTVHAWMKWNDRTVRRLALALREQGGADGFLVLADALRDAGCDSADLLASCGPGAHDQDRAWALKVLLG
jgi:hypothetical protein